MKLHLFEAFIIYLWSFLNEELKALKGSKQFSFCDSQLISSACTPLVLFPDFGFQGQGKLGFRQRGAQAQAAERSDMFQNEVYKKWCVMCYVYVHMYKMKCYKMKC